MDVATSAGVPILTGQPILTGSPIFTRFYNKIPGLPAGFLMAVDLTGNNCDPTEFTLGGDVQVIYWPAS